MKKRPIAVASLTAACAATAVAVPIAQGTKAHSAATAKRTANAAGHGAPPPGGPGGPGGPPGAVHSVSVVPNKAGNGFVTVTTDHGSVQSVDAGAGTITLSEGTKSLKYQTVTLTIPSDATVTLDGKSSSLGALEAEDQVTVSSSSQGTMVFAADSSFHPQDGGPGTGWPGGPGGPPPGSGSSSSGE